jgi:hypothetical protein
MIALLAIRAQKILTPFRRTVILLFRLFFAFIPTVLPHVHSVICVTVAFIVFDEVIPG